MMTSVLVLNTGSSSIKFQLLDPHSGDVRASGMVERVGEPIGTVTVHVGERSTRREAPINDSVAGLTAIVDALGVCGLDLRSEGVAAIGHRVVHGGAVFRHSVVVDAQVLATISELASLAPLHNPPAVRGIEAATKIFPDVASVAVFDTAFFSTLPPAAYTYAIDTELAAAYGVRRYGFHGTSHRYVSGRVAVLIGRPPEEVNQIVMHLGNGASMSAIRGGEAVETSMGLTPLEGLVMGTRSGDIDPGAVLHLARAAGLSIDGLDNLLNRRSGVLGLSGVNDFRELTQRIASGDERAKLAFDVYVHRLRKYIGAYIAVLGEVDVITFTAGVGENSPLVRGAALESLDRLGIRVDAALNQASGSGERRISAEDSPITVLVVPTNEELAIARETADVLGI